MALREGVYVVPTGSWYIERTVWLIAGVLLLICTALAVLVNPLWIFGVVATGLVSINVALTGFCPVGMCCACSVASRCWRRAPARWNLYYMQTDSWYLERRIYVTVGVNITLASILFLTHSPWWGLFTSLSALPWSGLPPPASASWPTYFIG